MRDDDTEIPLQSGLLCTAERIPSQGRVVHSCIPPIKLSLVAARRRPPSSLTD
ncbi:hypothetical protein DPMN_187001 [Dreissena polymorpha]|uniref:Uncharacterized protein n=1 Tax=Dreissena polymorpha TaxID=45954 RepID=A0A9D4DN73_DREPO|nr:hypothetical protein DPMN_187001 [Dreissena polymorpha]